MKEIFKDIKGFEKYQISNLGRVRNVVTGKVLIPGVTGDGYNHVVLYKESKPYARKIHLLVAQAFLPNPNNHPCVNHKDENKLNNNVNNLEWCSAEYYSNYGTCKKKMIHKSSKTVLCIDTGDVYPSTHEVQRQLGFSQCNISSACLGKLKTAYGLCWKYID